MQHLHRESYKLTHEDLGREYDTQAEDTNRNDDKIRRPVVIEEIGSKVLLRHSGTKKTFTMWRTAVEGKIDSGEWQLTDRTIRVPGFNAPPPPTEPGTVFVATSKGTFKAEVLLTTKNRMLLKKT